MRFMAVLVLGVSLVSRPSAHSPEIRPGASAGIEEMELLSLEDMDLPLMEDERLCGKYFVLSPTPGMSGKHLLFRYLPASKCIAVYTSLAAAKFRVYLDEEKTTPTVAFRFPDDLTKTEVIVRISKGDYETVKECLPKPK